MPDLPIHLFWLIFFAYILLISICSIVVCVYDKKISKRNNVKLRIPEKSLFIWSAVGGSVAMYLTMHLIRHKTKHTSFMVGIPVIIILQAAAIFALAYFGILPPLF
ncbi:MAG: DUF1294 domain-containing protein [Clostridia bacterium]|nr:DUF1294 domain-containing protein [Clostridia bacterium]